MDARNYLRQVHQLETKISMRQRQLKDLRKSIVYMKSMDYSAVRVQTSANGDGPFTKEVIELTDMEKEVAEKVKTCEALRNTIIHQIEGMDDQRHVDVLSGVYIHRNDLMDIAEALHYDYFWTCHLHGEALKAFEQKYPGIRNVPQDVSGKQ